MSLSVRVQSADLEGVACTLHRQRTDLLATEIRPSRPDAGRSTDELATAITTVDSQLTQLAVGVGALAGLIEAALADYRAWEDTITQEIPSPSPLPAFRHVQPGR